MDIVIYDLPLVVGLISLTVVIVKVLAYKADKRGEWSVKVVGAQAPKTDQILVGVMAYGLWIRNYTHYTNKQRRNEMVREMVKMKGIPTAVVAQGNLVEVWVSSPTGDSSDSYIYSIPCVSPEQAKVIAETWQSVWALSKY